MGLKAGRRSYRPRSFVWFHQACLDQTCLHQICLQQACLHRFVCTFLLAHPTLARTANIYLHIHHNSALIRQSRILAFRKQFTTKFIRFRWSNRLLHCRRNRLLAIRSAISAFLTRPPERRYNLSPQSGLPIQISPSSPALPERPRTQHPRWNSREHHPAQ